MTTFEIIDPAKINDWNSRLEQFEGASFFHTTEWANVLQDTYGFIPCYVVGSDGDKIVSILPMMETADIFGRRYGVSLPFSDFCEALSQNGIFLRNMLSEAAVFGKKRQWHYLELRGGKPLQVDSVAWSNFYTHEIDLRTNNNELLAAMRDSTRRNVLKAEHEKITVTHEVSIDAVKEFCRMNEMTRRSHGLPPQPKKFFESFHQEIISKGFGFVSIARKNNVAIAANVIVRFNKNAIYKFGASDHSFLHLRPNNFLMWECIKRCREIGCDKLNLGRTEIHHKGLLQFKRGFGVAEYTISYYRKSARPGTSNTGKQKKGAFRKVVLSLMPFFMLRLIGEKFYRFAGAGN